MSGQNHRLENLEPQLTSWLNCHPGGCNLATFEKELHIGSGFVDYPNAVRDKHRDGKCRDQLVRSTKVDKKYSCFFRPHELDMRTIFSLSLIRPVGCQ